MNPSPPSLINVNISTPPAISSTPTSSNSSTPASTTSSTPSAPPATQLSSPSSAPIFAPSAQRKLYSTRSQSLASICSLNNSFPTGPVGSPPSTQPSIPFLS